MEDISKYFTKLAELSMNNSVDFIEYFSDFIEMRIIKEAMTNESIRKQIYDVYNNFMINNGILYRIKPEFLNDEQKTYISLISNQNYKPSNRYRQEILNYYYTHLNEDMKNIKLEDIDQYINDFTKNYYAEIPGVDAGLKKKDIPEHKLSKFIESFYLSDFIKLGQQIQFDIDGFAKNQILYIIWGMCIYDVYNRLQNEGYQNFEDLINHIKAYVQINLLTKCINGLNINEEKYNLITFINFNKDGKIVPNYRYTCADKYNPKNNPCGSHSKTKLVTDEKGKYILTEYNYNELRTSWQELEELYQNNDYDNLIIKWFDSQCLTRSTCLIGCILISVLKGKLIKFKTDEMPDWKAIIEGEYLSTFEEVDDLKNIIKRDLSFKLNDVLFILAAYSHAIQVPNVV